MDQVIPEQQLSILKKNLYTGKWEAKATIETKTADDIDRPHGNTNSSAG